MYHRSSPLAAAIVAGFPRVMMAAKPMEIVITPNATYFMIQEFNTLRRVYTDGRKFPEDFELSYTGYLSENGMTPKAPVDTTR